MLINDFAVCLGVKPFKDNLKILNVFSKENGRFSVLLRINKKQPIPVPLSILKIECLKKESGIGTIQKLENVQSNSSATLSPIGATTSLFICELIYKCVPEYYINSNIYQLLLEAVSELKLNPNNTLIALKSTLIFLRELGVLNQGEDLHEYKKLNAELQTFISHTLNNTNFNQKLSGSEKKTIMECCLQHLRIHFQTKLELNSLEYFHIVFQV
ncbi:MAG: Recombination protein terminal [Bacteroidota bacterium]|jgi:DNA repair protein RecO